MATSTGLTFDGVDLTFVESTTLSKPTKKYIITIRDGGDEANKLKVAAVKKAISGFEKRLQASAYVALAANQASEFSKPLPKEAAPGSAKPKYLDLVSPPTDAPGALTAKAEAFLMAVSDAFEIEKAGIKVSGESKPFLKAALKGVNVTIKYGSGAGKKTKVAIKGGLGAQSDFQKKVYKQAKLDALTSSTSKPAPKTSLTKANDFAGGTSFLYPDGAAIKMIKKAESYNLSKLSSDFKDAAKASRVPDIHAVVTFVGRRVVNSTAKTKADFKPKTWPSITTLGHAFSPTKYKEACNVDQKIDAISKLSIPFPYSLIKKLKNKYIPASGAGVKYKVYSDADSAMASLIFTALENKTGELFKELQTVWKKTNFDAPVPAQLEQMCTDLEEQFAAYVARRKAKQIDGPMLPKRLGKLVSLGAKLHLGTKKMADKSSSSISPSALKLLNTRVSLALWQADKGKYTSTLSSKAAATLTGTAHDIVSFYTDQLLAMRKHKQVCKSKPSKAAKSFTQADVVNMAQSCHGSGQFTMKFDSTCPIKFTKATLEKREKTRDFAQSEEAKKWDLRLKRAELLLTEESAKNHEIKASLAAHKEAVKAAFAKKAEASRDLAELRKSFGKGSANGRGKAYRQIIKATDGVDGANGDLFGAKRKAIEDIVTVWAADQLMQKLQTLNSRPSNKLASHYKAPGGEVRSVKADQSAIMDVYRLFRNGPRLHVGFSNDPHDTTSLQQRLCIVLGRYEMYQNASKIIAEKDVLKTFPDNNTAKEMRTLAGKAAYNIGSKFHAAVKLTAGGDGTHNTKKLVERFNRDKSEEKRSKKYLALMTQDEYTALSPKTDLYEQPLYRRCGIQNSYKKLFKSFEPAGLKLNTGGKLALMCMLEWVLSSLLCRAQLFKNCMAKTALKNVRTTKRGIAVPAKKLDARRASIVPLNYDQAIARGQFAFGPHIMPRDLGAAVYFPTPNFALINLFEYTHTKLHQGEAKLPTYVPRDVLDEMTDMSGRTGNVKTESKALSAAIVKAKDEFKTRVKQANFFGTAPESEDEMSSDYDSESD